MTKTFEEFWTQSGLGGFKETALMAWEARQEEIDELKAQLRPFLMDEFHQTRAWDISKAFYPTRHPKSNDIYWDNRERYPMEVASVESYFDEGTAEKDFPEGITNIDIQVWSGDHTEFHRCMIPKKWMDFDNKMSTEEVLNDMRRFLDEEKLRIEAEQEEKTKKANLDRIARLEKELEEAKGKL